MILQQNNLPNFNFTHLEVKFMLGVNLKNVEFIVIILTMDQATI